MIGYVTLGTNDLARGSAFYDALLAGVGAKRAMQTDRFVLWGNSPTGCMLGLFKPFDGQPATPGNGAMAAIAASNPEQVDALHAKALELGATCEGKPGPRIPGFYLAYFRDLDGNKLNAFCMTK